MQIMTATVNNVVEAMKAASPLFKELYQKQVYTGSYYDGLRVSEANEFDLNLVMRLPFAPTDVQVEVSPAPAFVKYRLKRELQMILATDPKWTKDKYQLLLNFFEDRYLLRDKMQSWYQGVIDTAWKSFKKPAGVQEVIRRQSGPAITLNIKLSAAKVIDVDLVPVIDGSIYSMPPGFTKTSKFNALPAEAKVWYLVPKPLSVQTMTPLEMKRCWRISFPEAEKKLLGNLACVKPLIKLFKLLRDVKNWSPIASYFIKSLFLLEVELHPQLEYWQEKNMGSRFLEMIQRFKQAVEQRSIPYYFNRQANLLSGLDKATAQNIARNLEKIISQIETDPTNLLVIYQVNAKA